MGLLLQDPGFQQLICLWSPHRLGLTVSLLSLLGLTRHNSMKRLRNGLDSRSLGTEQSLGTGRSGELGLSWPSL